MPLMTVGEHLRELKSRLVKSAVLIAVIAVGIFFKVKEILGWVLNNASQMGYEILVLSPQETLVQEIRICLTGGLMLAVPFILYQLSAYWSQPERFKQVAKIVGSIAIADIMFLSGAGFAVFIMMPFMLRFMQGITASYGFITTSMELEKYIGFYISDIVIFGVVAEMPVLTVLFTRIGILSDKMLKKVRPYAVVLIFVIGAIVTPPDVASQLMVAVPMCLIYEACIVLSGITKKRRRRTI